MNLRACATHEKVSYLHVVNRRIRVIRVNNANYVILIQSQFPRDIFSSSFDNLNNHGQKLIPIVQGIKSGLNSLKDLFPFFYFHFKGAD